MTETTTDTEQHDLLETLTKHRHFLRVTVDGLTDEQAARRTTISALSLGGLIKHVTAAEAAWVDFIVRGPVAVTMGTDERPIGDRTAEFRMMPGETLVGLLAEYDAVARHTDELVAKLTDLDASHPLPEAPWFERGARWSARRALLHIIAETAQHAGHADIIRESLDGTKTMG
jgi:hypothetical protein